MKTTSLCCVIYLSLLNVCHAQTPPPPKPDSTPAGETTKSRLARLESFVFGTNAAKTAADQSQSLYASGRFDISPYAAYKCTEIGKQNGKLGGGLAVSYFLANNIAAEASFLSYGYDNAPMADSFDEAAINFKGYLPFGTSGLAPYILIGYTRDLPTCDNLMNAGAGIAATSGRLQAFADGQYRQNFHERGNQFLFRVGVGLAF